MIPAGAAAEKNTRNATWNQTAKSAQGFWPRHAIPVPEALLEGEFRLPKIDRFQIIGLRGVTLFEMSVARSGITLRAWPAPAKKTADC